MTVRRELQAVRVLTAISGGSAPVSSACGMVEQVTDLAESTARILCRGEDAFLQPLIEPGLVTYLPGADPTVTPAPVPEDECGADDEPTVVPGSAPEEPPADETPEGEGPEAPPVELPDAGGEAPPVTGRVTYMVFDVNGPSFSTQEESGDPTGNVIDLADRPLQGDASDLSQHDIWIFRSTPITTWAPTTAYLFGQRVRRHDSDPYVFQCSSAGTSGAVPPGWDEDAGDTTTDGSVEWTSQGDCSPITDAVPGTHIRISGGVSVDVLSDVRVRRAIPNGGFGPDFAAAPADLDVTLSPSYNPLVLLGSSAPVHIFSEGGTFTDLEIEIGTATALLIRCETAFGGSAAVSLSKVQFYTPEP